MKLNIQTQLRIFVLMPLLAFFAIVTSSSLHAQSYISGLVFDDTDANGQQVLSEGILSGITLEIYADDGAGNIGGPAFDTQTTFFDGSYKFNNLTDGLYCIRVGTSSEPPTNPINSLGTSCGLEINALAELTNIQNVDFGLFQGFKISGTVFSDEDFDLSYDIGDAAISGKQVELYIGDDAGNTVGSAIDSKFSSSQGNFQFSSLSEGSYCLKIIEPNLVKTSPLMIDVGTDTPGEICDINFSFVAGGPNTVSQPDQDFGLFSGFDLSGLVFNDANNSGGFNVNEQGLSNRQIELYTHDGNGGVSGVALSTQTTNSGGFYSFIDLPAGSYCLASIASDGYASSPDIICGIDFGANPGSPQTTGISGQDFGIFDGFALSGQVFEDLNNSATKDVGEAGLSGRQVELYIGDGLGAPQGQALLVQTSNSAGDYSFTELAAGSYCLVSVAGSGSNAGFPSSPAAICSIEVGTTAGNTQPVSLTDLNFGIFDGFALSGQVFEDLNNSATKDVDEAGIATRQIALYLNDGVAPSPGALVTTYVTDPTGGYSFEKLAAGTYCLALVAGDGSPTTPLISGNSLPGLHCDVAVNPATSISIEDLDFGVFPGYDISGSVADLSITSTVTGANGIGAVVVSLYKDQPITGVFSLAEDLLVSTTLTDANGQFSFIEQPPDSYCVVVLESTLDPSYLKDQTDAASCFVLSESMSDLSFKYDRINPVLGTALEVVAPGVQEGSRSGRFTARLKLIAENQGNTTLSGLNLELSLAAQLPAGAILNSAVASQNPATPTPTLTLNSFYNGSSEKDLLEGVDVLASGQRVEIFVDIEFSPNANASFSISAKGDARSTDGNLETDVSHQGNQPDPDGIGADNHSTPTLIAVTGQQELGLSLDIVSIEPSDTLGVFDVSVRLYLINNGNLLMSNIQTNFDLTSFLPMEAVVAKTSGPFVSGNLTIANPTYDGNTNTDLLSGTQNLKPDETAQIALSFSVDIGNREIVDFGPYNSSALISGFAPAGQLGIDLSDPGTNPTINSGGLGTPSPLDLNLEPKIGLALALVSDPVDVSGVPGFQMIELEYFIQNIGPVFLNSIQIETDLQTIFSTSSLTIPANLMPSLAYYDVISVDPALGGAATGIVGSPAGDPQLLLNGAGKLAPSEGGRVRLRVVWDSDYFTGPYDASAKVTAVPPVTSNLSPVFDISNDGVDPDSTTPSLLAFDNASAGEYSTTTTISVSSSSSMGLAIRLLSVEDGVEPGRFIASYELLVQNTGNQPLESLVFSTALATAFPAPSQIVSFSAGAAVNNILQPATSAEFLANGGVATAVNLDVALEDSFIFTVEFDANGVPSNQFSLRVSGQGIDPIDNFVADQSDNDRMFLTLDSDGNLVITDDPIDGFDTDEDTVGLSPQDNGEPQNNSQPTPILLPEKPSIGLAMNLVSIVEDLGESGTFLVDLDVFAENLGNVLLEDFEIELNLEESIGVGFFAGLSAPVTGSGSIPINAGYTGSSSDLDGTVLVSPVNSYLGVGEDFTVNLQFRISPDIGGYGPFTVQALGSALSPDSTKVLDFSNDSSILESDPNDDGQANTTEENIVTSIVLPLSDGIGIALKASRGERTGTNGLFSSTFDIKIQNVGNTPIEDAQISLDLKATFDDVSDAVFKGITSSGIQQLNGSVIALNPLFDGNFVGDKLLLDPNAINRLGVGSEATFRITGLFEVNGQDLGPFYASAIATAARAGSNLVLTDVSETGEDPDPDTAGNQPAVNRNPFDNNRPSEITIPGLLGISKQVSSLGVTESATTPQGGLAIGSAGQFDVTFEIQVSNVGGEVLSGLNVSDNLTSAFGNDAVLIDVSNPIVDGTIIFAGNSGFNGGSIPDLLLGVDTLDVGEIGTIQFTARFEAVAGVALSSRAEGKAVDKNNNLVEDKSQNGDDSDPDNDGDPTNNSEPTVVTPGFRSELGLAQQVVILDSGPFNNGPWRIEFTYVLENSGNTRLSNLSLNANMFEIFGPRDTNWNGLSYSTQVGGTTSSVFVNNSFNGAEIPNFLSPISVLLPGETAEVSHEITITGLTDISSSQLPSLNGDYSFNSMASAQDPNGTVALAISVDGLVADIAGDGPQNDLTPSTLKFSQLKSNLFVANSEALSDGTFEITYGLSMVNTGATIFGSIQIENNLRNLVGEPFIVVTSAPLVDAFQSTIDTIPNPVQFEGEIGASNYFDGVSGVLVPGQTLGMTFKVKLDPSKADTETGPNSEIFNQITVSGISSSPDGGENVAVTDYSDNGENPLTNNGQGGTDDQTPLELSAIAAALEVTSINRLQSGNHVVQFVLRVKNQGTADLSRVRVRNDIISQFGGIFANSGAFVALTEAPFFVTPPQDSSSSIILSPNWALFQSSEEMIESGSSSALAAQDGFVLQFSVQLDRLAPQAPTPLTNQIEVSGFDDANNQTQDLSDDGPSSYGGNAYGGVNDPTPLLIYGTGVVYDSVRRIPVEGARVMLMNLSFNGGPIPVDLSCLPEGVSNPQITGPSGEYSLDIQFPSGNPESICIPNDIIAIQIEASHVGYFDLEIDGLGATRGGVAVPSQRLIQEGCADDASKDAAVGLFGCQIQQSPAIPVFGQNGSPDTDYHLNILTTDNPFDRVFNNHIPLDPAPSGVEVVSLFKRAIDFDVSIGEFARWEIIVTNLESLNLPDTSIIDILPIGFIYNANSSSITVDGVAISDSEPETFENKLTWTLDVPAEARVIIKFDTVIGAGVPLGVYQNQAEVQNTYAELLSERVSAAIRIVLDPVFDCADIVGKVFHDTNKNDIQDKGEAGVSNAVVYTSKGKSVKTDVYGRYSLPCVMVPKEGLGSNFLVKLHQKSLPKGYVVNSVNPKVVRLTRGRVTRANFAVLAGQVLRMVVTDAAFTGGVERSRALWAKQKQIISEHVSDQTTSLKIVYRTPYVTKTTRLRLQKLSKAFKKLLVQHKSSAVVETEIVRTNNP